MESVEKNKNGGSVPRKIDVNFSKAEEEFNSSEKTLEDIIDEELAFNESAEPVIEEKVDNFKKPPIEFEVNEPVFVADESENLHDLALNLTEEPDENVSEGNAPEEVLETSAKILTMEEETPVSDKKVSKKPAKKKSGKGLIGFLLGVIFATVVLFALFCMMSMQIIPNDFFPGKVIEPEEPKEPVAQEEVSSELDLTFLKMNNAGQNLIYSPLSIKYALSMLSEGASGNTKAEIDNVLGDLNLTKYENTPEILSLANSVFIRDGFAVRDEFKTSVSERYNSEILNDPFIDAANINGWISNKTFNLIQNAVSNDAINHETMMALVNALAIQMEWESKFEDENTYGAEFVKTDGSTMSATTMHETFKGDDLSYYIDDDVTVLRKDLMAYGDTQLEFAAIMPSSNLTDFITGANVALINSLLEKTTLASETAAGVSLSMPKFKFEYELANFRDNLISLGVKDAFEPDFADFSKIADLDDDENLYVSSVIHKANIDFSEDGIKAAAVTVLMMDENAVVVKEQPVIVKIDKPFFFEIRDKKNGEVWFMGTVYEPNLWENDKSLYISDKEGKIVLCPCTDPKICIC